MVQHKAGVENLLDFVGSPARTEGPHRGASCAQMSTRTRIDRRSCVIERLFTGEKVGGEEVASDQFGSGGGFSTRFAQVRQLDWVGLGWVGFGLEDEPLMLEDEPLIFSITCRWRWSVRLRLLLRT